MKLLFLLIALFQTAAALATVYAVAPENYLQRLPLLAPGDTLSLAAGSYSGGLPVHHLHGTAGAVIAITGPATGARAVFMARAEGNTVSIANSSYIDIRHLTIDGQGVNTDAFKAEGDYAHHITLDGNVIVNFGSAQQNVGISTKCPAWNWIIRNNIITGIGTGIYLGNSDGSHPFIAGIIERNLIQNTIGYNLQIKHQNTRPTLKGLPPGNNATIIRDNVFSKSSGGATDSFARPNVLVGHFPPEGAGANDVYLIYRNFFYENATESLFQGEGHIAFYNNVLTNSAGNGVTIQSQNGRPRRVSVFFNTIVVRDTGINVSGGEPGYVQLLANNLVFAATPLAGGIQKSNITGTLTKAIQYLTRPFGRLAQIDFSPKVPLAASLPTDTASFSPFRHWNIDFNGRIRQQVGIGAYAGPALFKTSSGYIAWATGEPKISGAPLE